MPLTPSRLVALFATAALLAVAGPALADVKEACVDASTQGQSLRDAAKLKDARGRFVECARDACPAIVRKACADWLADVDRRLPSVVFRAQLADGGDVLDARLTLDGAAIAHGLDGAAIAVDPGEHDVRFERDGSAPVTERIVIAEGEKGRVVTGRFAAANAVTTPPATPGETGSRGRKLTPLAIALAAVGGAGLVSFTYFGLTANGDLNHLRQTCAPYCSSSQLSSVKTEALVADISLGVGVAALAAAAYVFFLRQPHGGAGVVAEPAVTFDVRPARGGAFGGVGIRF